MFQLIFVNTTICYASQAWNYPSDEAVTIVEYYDYGFIGTVINKTVEPDSTQYVFNVTEYLRHPLNSTEIYLTVGGGSEIAVSPSTSFFLDKEYIICFDELGKNFSIVGFDYTFTLLNSIDSDVLENIRNSHDEKIDVFPLIIPSEHDVADDYEIRQLSSFARTLVEVALFSLAGIISIFLLKKSR